jgi:hypothetical protein
VSPNDKINVGIVGCGVRGNYIRGEAIAAGAGRINVVGICDVWKVARDKMAADLAGKHGMKPEPFARHQDLIREAAQRASRRRDCARPGEGQQADRPGRHAAAQQPEVPRGVRVRALGGGPICKIETAWNRNVPSWSRPVDMVRSEDVDWEQYQADLVLPAATETSTGSLTQGDAGPHVANWIECLGTRKQPNAPIEVGLAHAIVCCLGRETERTGRKMRYDATARRIVEA